MHAATPAPDGRPPASPWLLLVSFVGYGLVWVAIGYGLIALVRYAN